VRSSVIVELQPWFERSCPMLAGAVHRGVAPFAQHRLDEPFSFAVGPRPVGTREQVLDAESFDCAGVEFGSVVRAVVGHDPFDGHTPSREPGDRAFQELDTRFRGLIGQDLDVRDAAGVIDRDVTGLPTSSGLRARTLRGSSGHSVAGTAEPAQLLDVSGPPRGATAGSDDRRRLRENAGHGRWNRALSISPAAGEEHADLTRSRFQTSHGG
jgi:hypothetical protein